MAGDWHYIQSDKLPLWLARNRDKWRDFIGGDYDRFDYDQFASLAVPVVEQMLGSPPPDAPPDWVVDRGEVYTQKRAELLDCTFRIWAHCGPQINRRTAAICLSAMEYAGADLAHLQVMATMCIRPPTLPGE